MSDVCGMYIGQEWERAHWLTKALRLEACTEAMVNSPTASLARRSASTRLRLQLAAPLYLRGRVERAEPLPEVVVSKQGFLRRLVYGDDEKLRAVALYVLRDMNRDLVVGFMEMIRPV